MTILGNDVIDLADPETAAAACHPRFDARVFTPQEIATLARGDARRRRWILWAAKEAAYKAARASDPAAPFSPRRFEVTLHGSDRATVRHRASTFAVALAVGPELVHAVARALPGSPAKVIAEVACSAMKDPSRAARALAAETVAGHLGIASSDLRVERARRRPPLLLCGALQVVASLSLSHHGRFVAFACALPHADERTGTA